MKNTYFSFLCIMLLLCFHKVVVFAQTPVYTLRYDKVSSPVNKNGETGIGHLIIYDDKTIEYYGKGSGNNVAKYSFKFQAVSSVFDSMLTFYSDDGHKDTKQPYIIIGSNGIMAIYQDKRNQGQLIDKYISCTNNDANTSVMNILLSDFNGRKGVFSGFRSQKDLELPLKINGYGPTYNITISAQGSEEVYPVRTKTGKIVDESAFNDYTVTSDSYWANIKTKTSAAFLVNFAPNNTGSTRKATITVTCDDVNSTMTVTQPSLTSKINRVWVEHNKLQGLVKGMKIHVAFDTYNVRGVQGSCNAYFFFANGNKLMDYNMQYRAIDGQVSTYANFLPSYDATTYNDFVLFIPYSELHINGAADCKFHVEIHIGGQTSVGEDISFRVY